MALKSVETQILELVVDEALAAGYAISVIADGEDTLIRRSRDRAAILSETQAASYDVLSLYGETGHAGNIMMIYGNDIDVISDYSTRLEPFMAPINKAVDDTF